MIAALLRLAAGGAAVAGAVALGRQHERTRPFGSAYWRAQAELALHLYDEPRLLAIHSSLPPRGTRRERLEQLAARSTRAVRPPK